MNQIQEEIKRTEAPERKSATFLERLIEDEESDKEDDKENDKVNDKENENFNELKVVSESRQTGRNRAPPYPCIPGATYFYKEPPSYIMFRNDTLEDSHFKFQGYWIVTFISYSKYQVKLQTGDTTLLQDGSEHTFVAALWPDDNSSSRPRAVVASEFSGTKSAAVTMFSNTRKSIAANRAPSRAPSTEDSKKAHACLTKLKNGSLTLVRLLLKGTTHQSNTLSVRSRSSLDRRTKRRPKTNALEHIDLSDDNVYTDDIETIPSLPKRRRKDVVWYYETPSGTRSKKGIQRSTLLKKIKAGEIRRNTQICPFPGAKQFKAAVEHFPERFAAVDSDMQVEGWEDNKSIPELHSRSFVPSVDNEFSTCSTQHPKFTPLSLPATPKSVSVCPPSDNLITTGPKVHDPPPPPPPSKRYYIHVRGETKGPVDELTLMCDMSKHKVEMGTLICQVSKRTWQKIEDVYPQMFPSKPPPLEEFQMGESRNYIRQRTNNCGTNILMNPLRGHEITDIKSARIPSLARPTYASRETDDLRIQLLLRDQQIEYQRKQLIDKRKLLYYALHGFE